MNHKFLLVSKWIFASPCYQFIRRVFIKSSTGSLSSTLLGSLSNVSIQGKKRSILRPPKFFPTFSLQKQSFSPKQILTFRRYPNSVNAHFSSLGCLCKLQEDCSQSSIFPWDRRDRAIFVSNVPRGWVSGSYSGRWREARKMASSQTVPRPLSTFDPHPRQDLIHVKPRWPPVTQDLSLSWLLTEK